MNPQVKNIFIVGVQAALIAWMVILAGHANAGRPLTVDDANSNEKSAGHLEYWWAREPGNAQTFNLAPAYAPFDGFEVAAAWARKRKSTLHATTVQPKKSS